MSSRNKKIQRRKNSACSVKIDNAKIMNLRKDTFTSSELDGSSLLRINNDSNIHSEAKIYVS